MIKFLDLHKINQPYEVEFGQKFQQFLDKGWYILGENVKQFESEFTTEMQGRMADKISGYHNYPNKRWDFKFFDLALLNGIYERLMNIQNLTSFMMQYINTHDKNIVYPEILNGLIETCRPSEEAILQIFGGQ